MKYSIRIETFVDDVSDIIDTVNQYKLWKLDPKTYESEGIGQKAFNMEVWLDEELDKNLLFEELKLFVDSYGGYVESHKCYHDEESSAPCLIDEVYRGV